MTIDLRAAQKLEEARYFLSQLEKTEGHQPDFGYLLSALVSSSRSVPLVLQKDLRSTFGKSFDDWWEARRKTIGDEVFWFNGIVKARNQTEKMAGQAASVFVRLTTDTGSHIVSFISETILIHFKEPLEIPPGEAAAIPIGKIIGDAKRRIELTGEGEVDQDLVVNFIRNEEPLEFQSFIGRFDEYLNRLASVIDDAKSSFENATPGTEELKR